MRISELMVSIENHTQSSGFANIVFDCDGVIFDSNALKSQAFRIALSSYPKDIVEKFIAYHQAHGGVSRYVKFRKFFSEFLKVEVDQMVIQGLLDTFGNACRQMYHQAEFTPGCIEVLKELAKKHSLFIASGSDEEELRGVFEFRGLADFFDGVFGSPKSKVECLQGIRKLGCGGRMLFVGDAYGDWCAACDVGATFIFMSEFSDARSLMLDKAEKEGFRVINTLNELSGLLNRA